MPFTEEWSADYYSEIYCPAIEKAGMTPYRADDLFAPNNVVEDIWNFTKKAKVIIADLTGKNPNVFYELGLAHAIAKPVILVTDSEEDIPYDLRAIRILKYDKNKQNWGEELKKSITQSIKEIAENPENAIPAPFLKASEHGERRSLTETDKEIINLKQEIALVKKEVRSRPMRHSSEAKIEPSQAEEMIRNYVRSRAPKEYIIRKNVTIGTSSSLD